MTYPTVPVSTVNMDAGTDRPADARSNFLDLATKFNALMPLPADLAAPTGATLVGYAGGTVATGLAAIASGKLGKLENLSDLASVPAALVNLGVTDYGAETIISSAATLTDTDFGRAFEIAGNSSNFTITLPTPLGNRGKTIIFRVQYAAQRMYALVAAVGTIDGEVSRWLWAGETAMLMSDGSDWVKIDGRTIPFSGGIYRTASQNISAGSWDAPLFNAWYGRQLSAAQTLDSSFSRFKVPRPSDYQLTASLSITGVGIAGANADFAFGANSLSPTVNPSTLVGVTLGTGASRSAMQTSGTFALNKDDYVYPLCKIAAGTSLEIEYVSGLIIPTLSYSEVPTW